VRNPSATFLFSLIFRAFVIWLTPTYERSLGSALRKGLRKQHIFCIA